MTTYIKLRTDFEGIIQTHGQQGILHRETEELGSMGDTKSIAKQGWTVQFMMQDITKKDRQIHEMGLAIPGNVKAFFYWQYPDSITGNGTLEVQAGDIIIDKNGVYWRIEQILGKRKARTKEIFKSCVLKKIDLDVE
jgi:hypothetical protein